MKIYLSNYRNHWLSPYTILEWLYRREIDYDDPTIEKWEKRLNPICRFIQRILDFIHPQISYVKIDRYDTWNTDRTLAKVILPMLKQLRETKMGSPEVDLEDVPEHMRSKPYHDFDDQDVFYFMKEDEKYDVHARWDWVLDEIIWTFEQILDDDADRQFHTGEHDVVWKEIEYNGEKMYEMLRGPNDTHKFDRVGYNAWNERQKNGLRLFGKYYRGLWD